jgi:NDP-sugar pyrophosphorylase family protein
VADDGVVLGVVPRGSPRPSFHFIGVQVANRRAFETVPAGQAANSVGDVYDRLIAGRRGSVRAHVCAAQCWDIGTVADYRATCDALAREAPPRAGAGPTLGSGARLIDSIAWDNVVLGDGSTVQHCILTDGVHVPPGASYSNMILMQDGHGQVTASAIPAEAS